MTCFVGYYKRGLEAVVLYQRAAMREMAHIPNWRIAYSGYFDAWVGRMKDDNGGLLGTGETEGGR